MKILITEETGDWLIRKLEEDGHKIMRIPYTNRKTIIEKIGGYEVLVGMSQMRIDKELLEKAIKLRFILKPGTGIDNIDQEYCKKKEIRIIYSPGENAESVAEHVILLMLGALRKINQCDQHVKNDGWREQHYYGNEIKGKTVGLVGFGLIGQLVAKKLQGFDVKMIAYDIIKNNEKAEEYGVAFVELGELYKNSDIISIHVPLIDSTKHMINKQAIEKMKEGTIIINTSRGSVIKEEDLIKALETGKIKYAGMDVFETEPPNTKIKELKNTVLTPHIAGLTEEAMQRMAEKVYEQFKQ